METVVKRKSMTGKRRSLVTLPRKASLTKKRLSETSKLSEVPEDLFHQWNDVKEDLENDNYIYGLHDEILERALEEVRERREKEERIREFVEGFCRAWVKLVRWRWMPRDDNRNAVRDDAETEACGKDPWSCRSYGEAQADGLPRSRLPAPFKCCPHPPLVAAEEIMVDAPVIERVWRREAPPSAEVLPAPKPHESFTPSRVSRMTVAGAADVAAQPLAPPLPSTAFPERAGTDISMGAQATDGSKSSTVKPYTSLLDIASEFVPADIGYQIYSRLDL